MARGQGRRERRLRALRGSGSVNLISMMDILTVLLLFLLKSYVAGGEPMVPAPGVRLPSSSADLPPQSSLVVAIDGDEILVGSEHVASLSEALSDPSFEIGPLAQRLQAERGRQEEIARLQGKAAGGPGVATIQGDRDIEFRVLKKVMYTLSQNGYENIALAVLQKS
jgi:biopolymer transport protein ExbD